MFGLEGLDLAPDVLNQLAQQFDPAPLMAAMSNAGGEVPSLAGAMPGSSPAGTPNAGPWGNILLPGGMVSSDKDAENPAGKEEEKSGDAAKKAPLTPQQLQMLQAMMPKPGTPHFAPATAPRATPNVQMVSMAPRPPVATGFNIPSLAALIHGTSGYQSR